VTADERVAEGGVADCIPQVARTHTHAHAHTHTHTRRRNVMERIYCTYNTHLHIIRNAGTIVLTYSSVTGPAGANANPVPLTTRTGVY